MTTAQHVRPEIATALCLGLGLTLMGFDIIGGVLALLAGLAVLVVFSVRRQTTAAG